MVIMLIMDKIDIKGAKPKKNDPVLQRDRLKACHKRQAVFR